MRLSSFAKVLKKDRLVQAYWHVVTDFRSELRKKNCTSADSIIIQSNIKKFNNIFPPLASDILVYSFGSIYLDTYTVVEYDGIDLLSDKRLIHEFGSYGKLGCNLLIARN